MHKNKILVEQISLLVMTSNDISMFTLDQYLSRKGGRIDGLWENDLKFDEILHKNITHPKRGKILLVM